MYGERGRFGLIILASDTSVLPEFQRAMPAGVQVYPSPILLPNGEVSANSLAAMLAGDQLERAAELLAWTSPQAILFACTSASLLHGLGWDRKLIERIELASRLPATTAATAVVAALRMIGARRLVVATPYIDSLNAIEADFLNDSGFEVLSIRGLGCQTDQQIGNLWPQDASSLVASLDMQGADAIFISCTSFHVLEIIEELEGRYGLPVITSNQAGAWQLLQMAGLPGQVDGLGQLFRRSVSAGATE